jgi:hypothetical protein
MQPKKVIFDAPYQLDGRIYEEVTVRVPVVKDAIAAQDAMEKGGQMRSAVVLMSRLTGLSEEAIENLPLHEASKIEVVLTDFFPDMKKEETKQT